MKRIYIILFFLSVKCFACDCNTPSFVEEFTTSDYIFEGVITSKIYSKDSLSYTITFDIYKHYKNSDNPKRLSFTLTSESQYQKVITSCDWSVNLNERWLVYAIKSNGELSFSKNCSNSQLLKNTPLYGRYQRSLDNANFLKVDDFIYTNEFRTNFLSSNPIIDKVLIKGKKKYYTDKYKRVGLYLLIDTKGNLKSANIQKQMLPIFDTIFWLQTGIDIDKSIKLTVFQKDAINLVSKVKKWEIRKHPISNIPISYFQFISIEYDEKNKKWSYELR